MNELPSFSRIEPRQREEDQLQLASEATPLELLEAVYTNPELPLHTRIKAAVEALPFVHPKLAVTAILEGKDFASRLERAIERSQTKMIEAPKPRDEFVDIDNL